MTNVIPSEMARHIREIGQAGFWRPRRVEQAELLDLNVGSLDDVRENLREMWQLNRWLGGVNALTSHLLPMLQDRSETTVLDLGTGGAEIPIFLTNWADRKQIRLQVIGVDWSTRNLFTAKNNIERKASIQLMQADALRLPLAESSVDIVISSLFMHHFTPDELINLLQKAFHASKRGIVMSDLVRGYMPLMAFKLISPIFARNWLTRHDGNLSIYRAYTPHEIIRLAHVAGLEAARVYTHFPARMTLIAEKSR